MLETLALTVVLGCLAWGMFPSVRASSIPADFAKLVLTVILFLTGPYCASVFFATFLDEPLGLVCAGWTIALVLWIAHRIRPAVDIFRALGQASPLDTHRLPWSQMATSASLAIILFFAAVRVVQTREY
jgi:hypothetical protein